MFLCLLWLIPSAFICEICGLILPPLSATLSLCGSLRSFAANHPYPCNPWLNPRVSRIQYPASRTLCVFCDLLRLSFSHPKTTFPLTVGKNTAKLGLTPSASPNAHGGTIYIGKDDEGSIVHLEDSKRLLVDIPGKIRQQLGLTLDVNLHETEEGDYLEIQVPPQSVPVSLRGRFYYRTGSTKTELSGLSLNEFLLKKTGTPWDASIEERASLEDIDPASMDLFLEDASKTGRLPYSDNVEPPELLDKLRLRRGNRLTIAALILFGKDPARFLPGMSVRIGSFGTSDSDLRFQEVVEGNLIRCLRDTVDQLLGKFLMKPITFEGIQRVEEPLYPLDALREVLLNALVHRRYQSGVHVQIRVYRDRLVCWNDGPLPEEISMDELLGVHASHPRNPLIADACFKAGYIDSWGRGISKITEACQQAGLPYPRFEEAENGIRVTLFSASTPQVTPEVGTKSGLSRDLVSILRKCLNPSGIRDLMKIAGRTNWTKFRDQVLKPLLEANLVEMTNPDKPTSPLQKNRLTVKGRALFE